MTSQTRFSCLSCLMICGLFLGAALPCEASDRISDPPPIFGAALSMNFPYENFGDNYNTGYGIHAIMDYPLIPLLDFSADIGWNHFPRSGDGEGLDVWEFAGGLRLVLGVFFMSGEVGYYTGVNDTSFLPGLGLRFQRLEFGLRIKAVTGGSWTGLRVGYYF